MAFSDLNRGTKRQTVAVVGSGLAGLATAYLLHNDRHQRYEVTILECGPTFSFNSASVSIRDESQRTIERIDLPMRAFAQGYYANLIRMYQYLGIRSNPTRFIYTFAKTNESGSSMSTTPAETATPDPYFVHTSNHHQIPPIRPKGMPLIPWLVDVVYVAACYFWWSFCCFWIQPRPATQTQECESLDDYMQRIMLPRRFVTFYLLPLLASVATCTHTALLQSPAYDSIEYKKRSAGGKHFTVSELNQVQQKLGAGIPARFSTMVKKIEPVEGSQGVRITSRTTDGEVDREETFDHVILAVAPGLAGKIYDRLESVMTQIPTTLVESVVQHHSAMIPSRSAGANTSTLPHTLHFRTSTALAQTESIHVYPSSGAIVTTCPLTDISSSAQHVLKSARFYRATRTPRSRRLVNNMFGENPNPVSGFSYADAEKKPLDLWKNGDDNVWLVGGWCWDGMVLLEGCVVSAMRVARALDVDVPWVTAQSSEL